MVLIPDLAILSMLSLNGKKASESKIAPSLLSAFDKAISTESTRLT